jgi:hypothetical protein
LRHDYHTESGRESQPVLCFPRTSYWKNTVYFPYEIFYINKIIYIVKEWRLSSASASLPAGVPNCLKKRQLLNEKIVSPELCRDYGTRFLDLGWREDALEFFRKGGVTDVLEKLRAYSVETGDAFLLARIGESDPDTWRHLAERALVLGKLQFARRAFEIAGDADKTAMVAGLIAGQGSASDEDPDN